MTPDVRERQIVDKAIEHFSTHGFSGSTRELARKIGVTQPLLYRYFSSTVFPATTLQTCIVHLNRNSLDYASWKDRRGLAAVIRPIYTAPSAEAAQAELDAFAEGPWGQKFPTVSAAWRNAWDRVIPFFAFPPAVRKVIYTTNAIENINSQLRKIIKTRGHFPTDEAATKLIWLALRNITADWGRAAHDWKAAMNQFAILYEDRFVRPSV